MNAALIEKIKKEIENFSPTAKKEEIGTVLTVADAVAEVEGLPHALAGEIVVFDVAEDSSLKDALEKEPLYGLVLNLEATSVKVVILGDNKAIREGMTVTRLGKILSVPVSDRLLGRVVDALGAPIDGKGAIIAEKEYPMERIAYGVIDRSPVNVPLQTGIKAIDAMIPIGRGQRELIIGDRGIGKTTLAIDTILSQKNEPADKRPICIYVAIGQKASKVARIVHELEERGAMEYTIVVLASAGDPAALQYLAPFAGAAIGEYFMESGRDAVVIYDDLSKHAVAYRQLSLLLRRPPGREAYPGDVFYLHSRLLERAAKLSPALGGGSLTALPFIETQEGDISAYIPTNVISITDGQIYLDTDIFNKGTKPAINVGLSVSRVGSSAQTKAMKKVAGRLRLELAQFRELEAFMQFAGDLDQDTRERIERGRRLSEVLTQNKSEPLSMAEEVVVLYAAVNGYFKAVAVEEVRVTEAKLLERIRNQHANVLEKIRATGDLDAQTEEELKSVLKAFFV